MKAKGSQLKLGLSEIQSATVESMKTNGVAATNRLMGEPVVQSFRMMYRGKELTTTQRLNQLLPISHSVSYILNDNERDRYYPGIFKPLEMNVGEVLALPVIELEGENAGQAEAVFVVNLVRTKDDSWLEFQVKAPLVLFDWLEDTLGCKLDCWSGPVESRWGWYVSS